MQSATAVGFGALQARSRALAAGSVADRATRRGMERVSVEGLSLRLPLSRQALRRRELVGPHFRGHEIAALYRRLVVLRGGQSEPQVGLDIVVRDAIALDIH